MEEANRARVHHLIGIAERETAAGPAGLADALRRWCWPGGGDDRTEPVARGWVRRWGPNLLEQVAFECTCADCRCELCN
jgi:hypothetical protein